MLPITDMLLTNHNRPGYKLIKPMGIGIHWTANVGKGSDADNNRNFFQNTTSSASAHFVVDDHQIVRCVPEDEVAYHVGAKQYTEIGKRFAQTINGKYYGPNYFIIGIEICVNVDGNFAKAVSNAQELIAYLLKKYNLTPNDIYRHYDITGKCCPAMMTTNALWEAKKKELAEDKLTTDHLRFYPWDTFKKEVAELMTSKSWQQTAGEKAIDELIKKGLLKDAAWKAHDLEDEPVPLWLFFEMLNRALDKAGK